MTCTNEQICEFLEGLAHSMRQTHIDDGTFQEEFDYQDSYEIHQLTLVVAGNNDNGYDEIDYFTE